MLAKSANSAFILYLAHSALTARAAREYHAPLIFPKIDALFSPRALSVPRPAHLLLIALVALAVRLAAGNYFAARTIGGAAFEFGDSEGYWRLGQELARGQPYQYHGAQVFRAPGYPLLLAGMFHLLGIDVAPIYGAR